MPFRVTHAAAHDHTIGLCIEKCWAVLATCSNGHKKTWAVADLGAFPAGATLGQVADRLVCRKCGATDGELSLRQDHTATARKNVERFERDVKAGRKLLTDV